jgi:hypothetical protein
MLEKSPIETLREFWKAFIDVCTGEDATFATRYNPAARPRTELMLQKDDGIIPKAAGKLGLPTSQEIAYSRYIDFSVAEGDWWAGEKGPLLAVEVENNWKELRGTLRDLLQFQARAKIGVFYHKVPRSARHEVEMSLAHVQECFRRDGFSESADTGYLIIIAPEVCAESQPARLDEANALLTSAATGQAWLEAAH